MGSENEFSLVLRDYINMSSTKIHITYPCHKKEIKPEKWKILHQLQPPTGVNRELLSCTSQAQRCLLLFLDEGECVRFMLLEQAEDKCLLVASILSNVAVE